LQQLTLIGIADTATARCFAFHRASRISRTSSSWRASVTAQSIRLTSVRFALFATLVALVTAPSAFAEQMKVVSNGGSANLSAYDGSCAWTSVSVSRNTTATGTETSIQYSVYDSCVGDYLTYGYGRIANADFKVSNKPRRSAQI
jgi:hypothetical protein